MNTAEQVAALIEELKKSKAPLSEAAWQTALACVGWPYVFGAWGEECTPNGRQRRYRDSHPTIKTACQVMMGRKASCDGCKWFPGGKRVRMFDCRGFTDWVLKQFGIDLQGEGATSQWNTGANWEAKGEIRDIPDDILVCLFVKNGSKMEHTGFGYKGQTCECSSGVQYFEKRKAKWTHWAVPRGIGGDVPEYKPTLRKGDTGEYVTRMQEDLIRLGYDCGKTGADGKFGNATEAALKRFQQNNGLAADGVCGRLTWNALEETPVDNTLYTVTVPHLTKTQAESLTKQYTGSTMTQEG